MTLPENAPCIRSCLFSEDLWKCAVAATRSSADQPAGPTGNLILNITGHAMDHTNELFLANAWLTLRMLIVVC
ncbi:hypothetical protein THAOC_12652 [Thalassiosira oceanica]|uniref:Uncharacterized protein n=1 Tax=Thalassiosira oceanica TaxID=159749 RepID=K0SZF6_THAOC|nr:hypothetical protein THAOC_12652 [Thalassiosira oceanica]|eukprot:EJK66436.1 hypothetical protein THAOC_12652 [Thalassiosira oceanica]